MDFFREVALDSDIRDKAKALQESFGHPSWLQAVGIGELGGEPALFVYVTGHAPNGAIPEFWRGVKVWVRRVGEDSFGGGGGCVDVLE